MGSSQSVFTEQELEEYQVNLNHVRAFSKGSSTDTSLEYYVCNFCVIVSLQLSFNFRYFCLLCSFLGIITLEIFNGIMPKHHTVLG